MEESSSSSIFKAFITVECKCYALQIHAKLIFLWLEGTPFEVIDAAKSHCDLVV